MTVRRAHETEMAEDYVELIAELIDRRGEARSVDLAERLGVKPPTVTKNIMRLQTAGLVRRDPYRSIFLTDRGQALAKMCRYRHRVVVAFLCGLGIDRAIAERDAEGIEHHVSEQTLKAFAAHVAERRFSRRRQDDPGRCRPTHRHGFMTRGLPTVPDCRRLTDRTERRRRSLGGTDAFQRQMSRCVIADRDRHFSQTGRAGGGIDMLFGHTSAGPVLHPGLP